MLRLKKLYPDADLPRFFVKSKSENELVIIYQSNKHLESFAHGLIMGCAKHFNKNVDVSYEKISDEPYQVEFRIVES